MSFPSLDTKRTDLFRHKRLSKCLLPRQHIFHKQMYGHPIIGEIKHFLNWEMKKFMKFKQNVWKNKSDWKKLRKKSWCFKHISYFSRSLVFVFRNEEKLIRLLVYTSFRQVVTSMLHKYSVFTSSDSQVNQAERNWEVKTYSIVSSIALRRSLVVGMIVTSPD